MTVAFLDHLWQSTLFALMAGLATLLFRNNGAGVRHGLWLAASLKFLFPFALLTTAGRLLLIPVHPDPKLSPFFCDQTVVTNNAMAEGTPFVVETNVLGNGACTQVIRRRS